MRSSPIISIAELTVLVRDVVVVDHPLDAVVGIDEVIEFNITGIIIKVTAPITNVIIIGTMLADLTNNINANIPITPPIIRYVVISICGSVIDCGTSCGCTMGSTRVVSTNVESVDTSRGAIVVGISNFISGSVTFDNIYENVIAQIIPIMKRVMATDALL
jgi:hypothetical protein